MGIDELKRQAAELNVNPYWLAWELCGSPNTLGDDCPKAINFVYWNNAQWLKTCRREKEFIRLCTPEQHLETLANTVTEYLTSAAN